MRLYEDKNLLNPIEDVYSFGIVPVGEYKEVTLWVRNDCSPKATGYLKNLEFTVICLDPQNDAVISSEKIEVVKAPTEMAPMEVAELVLKWEPNIDLEQGLKAKLEIIGQKIIG